MKSFADVRRRLQPGVILECVENTYRPELNGQLRRVEVAQTNAIASQLPQADGSFLPVVPRRELTWTYYPASARQVRIIDANTFSMLLGRGDHSLTLRFVGKASHA